MGPQELKEKLELHALWLEGDPKGKRANLTGANLRWANLTGADLEGAKLEGVNLEGVKTSYSNTWAKTFFFKGACSDALQWVEEQNLEDLNELVKNCPNPEWITWLKEKMILTHRKVNQHA